ncbi:MAG: rhomboid family intramembrane serine protease, partial [Myxococcota bacterium]
MKPDSDPLEPPPWAEASPAEPPMHRGWLSLGEEGFRYAPFGHVGHSPRARFHRYSDVTHLACGSRGLWIGTRQAAMLLRRSHFVSREAPEQLVRQLTQRIASQPEGAGQLTRIMAVERRSENPAPRLATTTLAVTCIGVMILQLLDPFLAAVYAFVPELVAHGEWWRVLSSNLTHSLGFFPFHLLSNLVLILGFGMLVERPLGATRTVVILSVSGLAAMTASS